jgi:hypothetical protein
MLYRSDSPWMPRQTKTQRDVAIHLMRDAYIELKKAGSPEDYFAIAQSIKQDYWGGFFGTFGSDTGCYIEVKTSKDAFSHAIVVFGIRRYKQRLFVRLKEMIKESWSIFRGNDSEFTIHLSEEDTKKFKDILRYMS